ncbi:hypothetical protein [Bacillus sp. JCM 19041]|uniref:YncE family protein n=1 Tax=Bacillus sp. JCM 19041 TaxID=1460637 RepID=UPI0006D215A1
MKRSLIGFIMVALLLSACGDESFSLPDENGSYAFVSHLKEPSLAVLDLTNDQIEKMEPLESAWSAQIAYGDNQIAALSDDGKEVVNLNLTNGEINTIARLDSHAKAIVYVSEQQAFAVALEDKNEVQLIDEQSGQVLTSIPFAGQLSEMIVADEGRLFVLSTEEERVYHLNVDKGVVENSFSVSGRPAGMFYDGELLWIGGHGKSGELNHMIYGYDGETGLLEQTIDVGLMPIAMTGGQDDSFFVLCHGDHQLYKIKEAEVVGTVEVGQNPNYVYAHHDQLLVSNFDSDTVTIVNKDPFTVAGEVAVGSGPHAIATGEIK